MLDSKRPRSPLPLRRTTSMKDVSAEDGPPPPPSDQEIPPNVDENRQQRRRRVAEVQKLERRWNGTDSTAAPSVEMLSSLGSAGGAGDFPAATTIKLSPFLVDCSLCKSHLLPSYDIFMYRGEAFCSLKCRQQLINHDIKKEKLKLFLFSMMKKASAQTNSQASKASGKAEETMAAA
ncbi:hypothetical protein KFK09_021778 [Dendrobium nobile]|uniref:FLZ-type domain-containing protein n=1 Tax=Dendrobium nobile TaxID=94219 RepID=A0A8T3AGP5_DENNO|nr:hypothetical protein KFK09_021778 [Dendrobium nobile]